MDLRDAVAVVTGASRGIGLETAHLLVDAGAHVAGLARSEDALAAAADRLGDRFEPVVCDITDPEAARAAIDGVAERHGRLDVLVNNAGMGRFGEIEVLSDDDWNAMMALNLTAVFTCTQAAAPHMRAQSMARGRDAEAGHIVNVGSIAGLIGNPRLAGYNASKYGLRGFSDATMKELRPYGIKVSCLYPGSVDTTFGGRETGERPYSLEPASVAATILHVLASPYRTLISEVVLRPMTARKV
ncbi:MAG: SDR family NAD(P)-dependent oxidoreductase [Bacteroidota bacterium]